MFFKYIDAADIRRSLFALRFELKDFEQKLQKLESRLSLYTDTEYRQELIIVEKASASKAFPVTWLYKWLPANWGFVYPPSNMSGA